MNFSQETINGIAIIRTELSKITLPDSVEFRELLLSIIDGGSNKILFDLSNVDFIDSTIIGLLILGLKKLSPTQGEIRFSGLTKSVEDTFILTKLNTRFKLFKTQDEAVSNF